MPNINWSASNIESAFDEYKLKVVLSTIFIGLPSYYLKEIPEPTVE